MSDRIFKIVAQRPQKYRADLLALGDLVYGSGQYESVRSQLDSVQGKKNKRQYKQWKNQQIKDAVEDGKLVGIITPHWFLWLIIKPIIISFLEQLFFGDD